MMNYVFAALALFCLITAIAAVVSRNLIHSALLFVLTWLGVAACYLSTGAEFVAFSHALVYVGGISMVVLFAVLLTRPARADDVAAIPSVSIERILGGLLAVFMVASVLGSAIVTSRFAAPPSAVPVLTVRRLGELLAGPHVIALLLVGVILTVALLGALLIAAPGPGGRRPAPAAGADLEELPDSADRGAASESKRERGTQ